MQRSAAPVQVQSPEPNITADPRVSSPGVCPGDGALCFVVDGGAQLVFAFAGSETLAQWLQNATFPLQRWPSSRGASEAGGGVRGGVFAGSCCSDLVTS